MPKVKKIPQRQCVGCREMKDKKALLRVVKAAFNQRRKTIRNSLRAAFGDFGGAEHEFFSLRPEVLGVAQFVGLTDWVQRHLRG